MDDAIFDALARWTAAPFDPGARQGDVITVRQLDGTEDNLLVMNVRQDGAATVYETISGREFEAEAPEGE